MRTNCIVQGTLLNALWWLKWEGNPKKRVCVYMYSWLTCIAEIDTTVQSNCCSVVSDSLRPQGLPHTRVSCPSLSPGVCSDSHPLSWWCHPIISSSVGPFSSCLQSFPALGSFPVSWLFASDGQSSRTSASASILPMNIQGWFPLGLTGLIFLQSKGLSRVFFSTIMRKHQFLGAQPSLWSNSHVGTWLLEKP